MVLPIIFGAKFLYDLNEASNNDERARDRINQAIGRESEARLMLKKEQALLDMRLENIIKKRKAVVEHSLPLFVKVYEKIQKVVIESKKSLIIDSNVLESLGKVSTMTIHTYSRLSGKEDTYNFLLGGLGGLCLGSVGGGLLLGLGKSIKEDSERYLSAARRQLSEANAVYAQAENKAVAARAFGAFAERMASLTAMMNILFLRVTMRCDEVIKERESSQSPYSENDIKLFMTCANIAGVMSNILAAPIADASGKITSQGKELVESGQRMLDDAKLMCQVVGV